MHKRITGGTLLSAFEPDRACLVERRTGSRLGKIHGCHSMSVDVTVCNRSGQWEVLERARH